MTTNYERIKNMTVDEMAEFLTDSIVCEECPGEEGCKGGCKEHQCLSIINEAKDVK